MRDYSEAERTPVRADALRLRDFRSFGELSLDGFGRVNVICGENGAGKTNIIESIWLFTGGKSFRPAHDGDLVRHGEKFAELELDFESDGRDQSARISLDLACEKKKGWLNGVPLRSVQELAGNFCCVAFTPSHMEIVRGGPENRRRFLDTLLCQMYPEYIIMLRRFKRVLLQRNAALKQLSEHPGTADISYMTAWNESYAVCAANVAQARESLCAELADKAQEYYSRLSGGKEQLGLRYLGGIKLERDAPRDSASIKAAVRAELERSFERELRYGTTLSGPHRAELQLTLSGREAKLFGSQGQQRSCVLALKMAEAALLELKTGHIPIVLLDDVLSELDFRRRSVVLGSFCKNQVFITCCDADRLNIKEAVHTIELG